jgi:F-type H+-transporting ATPase subunit gamma
MALNSKTVKNRLRSINNTRKITRAMEMVSAVKMRRAIKAVLSSRPYALNAWDLLNRLLGAIDQGAHPLISRRPQTRAIAMILVTANRGLCAGFNQQAIATAIKQARVWQEQFQAVKIDWYVMGKKGAEYLVRNQQNVVAEYEKLEIVSSIDSIKPLAYDLLKKYLACDYDLVSIIYTDYYSALVQKPRNKIILPLAQEQDNQLGSVASSQMELNKTTKEYTFEPSADILLDSLLPRFIEVQLYQAMLESNASEHSARMLAMKNASSSAADMISDLTLTYNQLRQAMITREIAEIAGGRVALGL